MKPRDAKVEREWTDFLEKCAHVDVEKNRLDVIANEGFFANCWVTLWSLTRTYPSARYMKVNWTAQDLWRNNDQAGKNLFDLYFHPNSDLDTHALANVPHIYPHGVYRDLEFDKLNPYISNYFAPSEIVRNKINDLVNKYKIDYDNTIGVWYRGTDKFTELTPVPPRYYVAEIQRLIRKNPRLRVLLQTDQEQIRDIFVREFGEQVFYLSELPVTKSLIGIHHISTEERGTSNFEFGTTLLAVINIVAKCRYVVTYTGCIGLWTYLYRGNAQNTCQLRPRLPDLISQYDDEAIVERITTRADVSSAIIEEENYELRSKNNDLQYELDAITTSFMYRRMKSIATKIDRLFPDNTSRGEFRKQITRTLRTQTNR